MTKQAKQKTQHEIPLQQALKDCRLAANLSIEDVALTLNLNITVIRDIEDNLEQVIAEKSYPCIYLRGYLANYAKAVHLLNLESFSQYQQLSHPEKSVRSLKNPLIISEKKNNTIKLTVIIFITVIAAGTVGYALNSDSMDTSEPALTATHSENTQMRLPENTSDMPRVDEQSSPSKESAAGQTVNSDKAVTVIDTPESIDDEKHNISKTNAVKEASQISTNIEQTQQGAVEQSNREVQSQTVEKMSNESPVAITETLSLRFKEDCWTEITDATGKRLALDLYKAGRELTLAGTPPFNLVLGNPFVVELFYQGKLVEREYKRGRTARFTLPE